MLDTGVALLTAVKAATLRYAQGSDARRQLEELDGLLTRAQSQLVPPERQAHYADVLEQLEQRRSRA